MIESVFPAARYRLDCVAETPVHFREYAGSTLRGAFGHALKRTVCMTRQPDCKACALYRTCPYPAVFAPPAPEAHRVQKFSDIPAPYVIEPMPWGEKRYAPGEGFSFHFVLIGRALAHLPVLLYAWQRALAHGVGVGEGRARLARVHDATTDTSSPIYDADEGRVIAHEATLPPPGPVPPRVTLTFQTQLRLQHEGRPLGPNEIRAERLLIGLVKRVSFIAEFHARHTPELNYADLAARAKTLRDERRLTWRDWTRYSNRQKQEMQLGGVIGEWTLEGDLAPFWPYLHLGQWLHVGKNATFGLGHYRLQPSFPIRARDDGEASLPLRCACSKLASLRFRADLRTGDEPIAMPMGETSPKGAGRHVVAVPSEARDGPQAHKHGREDAERRPPGRAQTRI